MKKSLAYASIVCLIVVTGCSTSRIELPEDRVFTVENSVAIIDGVAKARAMGWSGPVSEVGADDYGWSEIETVSSKSYKYGNTISTHSEGRLRRSAFKDIDHIEQEIRAGQHLCFFVLLCGLVTPVPFAETVVYMKNGESQTLSRSCVPERRLVFNFTPLWLLNPLYNQRFERELGYAFEFMRQHANEAVE